VEIYAEKAEDIKIAAMFALAGCTDLAKGFRAISVEACDHLFSINSTCPNNRFVNIKINI